MNSIIRLLVIAAALVAAPGAIAEGYPAKPVRVIVPFSAAGPGDIIARILAQRLTEQLGQQFLVDNRPGAGGNVGMAMVAKAPPDGYTILVVSSALVVNPGLYANMGFDSIKDLAPVTKAVDSPNVLTVHPSFPAKTVKELLAVVKANPGKYSYAAPPIGTTPHLGGELLKLSYGLDLVAVPFNGAAPALTSTVQNQTPISFTALPPATELVLSGQLRALAVTAKHRSPALPDVPTMEEAGVPGQESDTMQAVLVPAGTPRTIIDLLHREILKALAKPDVQARLAQLGFDPVGNSPDEFAVEIKLELEKWGKVVRAANIKVD
ncbi:MAG TPA: tripartite tricarboxylate transporter substrate binding protein [Alphaproteobacteria bacterium]